LPDVRNLLRPPTWRDFVSILRLCVELEGCSGRARAAWGLQRERSGVARDEGEL
jgi:hypothetical protein